MGPDNAAKYLVYIHTWFSGSAVQSVRIGLPHSIPSTLSSIHIRWVISALICSIAAHCSGGKIHYDIGCRHQHYTGD